MPNKINNNGTWYCPMCDTHVTTKFGCYCNTNNPDLVFKEKHPRLKELEDKIKQSEMLNAKAALISQTEKQPDSYPDMKRRVDGTAIKPDIVGNLVCNAEPDNCYSKEIWNAAIEAAAELAKIEGYFNGAETIRKLKK